MTIVGNTHSSRDALDHLRRIKPNDGWSIQIQHNTNDDDGVRLLRRNAPLTDHYFLDVHHDAKTQTIVGLLTKDAATCQGLVDARTGRPLSATNKTSSDSSISVEYVSCSDSYGGYKKLTESELQKSRLESENKQGQGRRISAASNTSRSSASASRSASRSARSNNNNTNANANANANPFAELSEEDKQKYLQYAMTALGVWALLKVLSGIVSETLLFFLLLPGLYLYGIQTCPENSSFDAKKEVKRVLRGHHLPDDHPNKPRRGNWFEEWGAKITASVATEVGAAAGGYELEMTPLLGGVATHATVTLPMLNLTCEWVGCHHTWYHLRTYTVNR